ncbi:MAG: hypothetical protein OHK0017_00260 [Patescibacteria group bacterium]
MISALIASSLTVSNPVAPVQNPLPYSTQDVEIQMITGDSNGYSFSYKNKLEEEKKEAERLEAERKAREEVERAEQAARLKAQAAKARRQKATVTQAVATQAPAPIVVPVSSSVNRDDARTMIDYYAQMYGVNPDKLFRVMMCESGGRSNAKNKSSSASGIMQFMPRTFYANAARVGIPNPDLWNPEHQIQTAAWMFSIGQERQWSCKG